MTQLNELISACVTGAKINCPIEPPALMKPDAREREFAGNRCAAAPIKMEKLPAPAPAAVTMPIANISPKPECMYGVIAKPSANSKVPIRITLNEPTRSASMPKRGWAIPHINWATAIAKLTVTMPSPVDVFSGDTNSPMDCRIPIVIARIAAAETTNVQNVRRAVISFTNIV